MANETTVPGDLRVPLIVRAVDLSRILVALGKEPYAEVAGLVQDLTMQANTFVESTKPSDKKDTTQAEAPPL